MKVLFVNPPNIRSDTSSVENDFAIKAFVVPPYLRKIKWSEALFRRLNKFTGLGNTVRYGVRAGSRWPFTMDQPNSDYAPYPFFMGYAASNLREHGFEVNIFDAVAEIEYDFIFIKSSNVLSKSKMIAFIMNNGDKKYLHNLP